MRRVLAPLLLFALVAGCHRGVRFENQMLTKPGVRYRVGEVSPAWARVKLSSNDLAWVAQDSGHALSVNATCKGHGDVPLDVLTRHLLAGFTERQEVSQEKVVVDEREALRSHFQAKLDGVPVELLLLVLKKDNCVYDFNYIAPLGRLQDRQEDFESLVQGFHAERTS
jgi:hypothetical protein